MKVDVNVCHNQFRRLLPLGGFGIQGLDSLKARKESKGTEESDTRHLTKVQSRDSTITL